MSDAIIEVGAIAEDRIAVASNWKLVWENNRECWHCNANHPQYVKANYDNAPIDDPALKHEIETHISRAASMDVWLREHPPVVEWKMNWPANTPDADEITAATCAAHERAALGTRFEGPAVVCGFAAVITCGSSANFFP